MNDIKLKKGQIIKNYKELCSILGVSCTTGNSRLSHLKEFERYCSYHKEGHSYIIDDVFKTPKPKQYKIGKRKNNGQHIKNSKYETLMDEIIISCINDGYYSFSEIFIDQFKIINGDNYSSFFKDGYKKYAENHNISEGLVQVYTQKLKSITKKCLITSLNRLQKNNILKWEETYAYIQSGKNRRHGNVKDLVTPDMVGDIIESERIVTDKEGITYMDRLHVLANKEFKESVVDLFNSKRPDMNMLTYYKVFNINFISDVEKNDNITDIAAELSKRLQENISLAVQNKTNQHKNVWGTVNKYQPYSLPHHIKGIDKLNKNTFKKITKNSTAYRAQ